MKMIKKLIFFQHKDLNPDLWRGSPRHFRTSMFVCVVGLVHLCPKASGMFGKKHSSKLSILILDIIFYKLSLK